ncbi:hypothetical protein SUNI508_10617 [Seiridium unicorne]|uniref:Uncharacterized protein n=1 Tax=Seiridium unicorne TaxID=138068 RepID=A0ABR2UK49_9PEZI
MTTAKVQTRSPKVKNPDMMPPHALELEMANEGLDNKIDFDYFKRSRGPGGMVVDVRDGATGASIRSAGGQ